MVWNWDEIWPFIDRRLAIQTTVFSLTLVSAINLQSAFRGLSDNTLLIQGPPVSELGYYRTWRGVEGC